MFNLDNIDKNKINKDDIRNTFIPLATARPDFYNKLIIVGCFVFYFMMVLSYFTEGFLTKYVYLEMGLIGLFLWIMSKIYDKVYCLVFDDIIMERKIGVIVGFSNTLLIINGEEVLDVYHTDKIKIRKVTPEENEMFFQRDTSIMECIKNGEIVGKVGIARISCMEGETLLANKNRVNEDIEIISEMDNDDDDLDGPDGGSNDSDNLTDEELLRFLEDIANGRENDDFIIEVDLEDEDSDDDDDDGDGATYTEFHLRNPKSSSKNDDLGYNSDDWYIDKN